MTKLKCDSSNIDSEASGCRYKKRHVNCNDAFDYCIDENINLEAIKNLSQPLLASILEFLIKIKYIDNWDFLSDSIKNLSRAILQDKEAEIFVCDKNSYIVNSSFRQSNKKNEFSQCYTVNDKKTQTRDENNANKNICQLELDSISSHQKYNQCLNSCTSRNCAQKNVLPKNCQEYEFSFDFRRGQKLNCLTCHGISRMLCVSIEESIKAKERVIILGSLVPYIEEAYERVLRLYETQYKKGTMTKNVRFTPREKEVLKWAALGKGSWETGAIIGISQRTVKFHLSNAYKKLNVSNRTQAVASAVKYNLI